MYKKLLSVAAVVGLGWLGLKYLLPVALPFLLGGVIALGAEPLVALLTRRLKLRRALASGVGVSATLVLLAGVMSLVLAVAVKELGNLASAVPDLNAGVTVLRDWCVNAADNTPENIRPLAQKTVTEFFDDGTALVTQLTSRMPALVTTVVSGVGNSVLGVGTAILSAFLISARLPALRQQLSRAVPEQWKEKYLPGLQRIWKNLGLWLKAQGKLCLITWGIVSVGFLVLRVPYAIAWAALVAVVDAIPILGTGTVLVPWALICLLQGESIRAIGLLCTYGAALLTRTALEPRLVGKQLGLDPLATLLALYVGYRFWGIIGMLLTPILASAARSLTAEQ